MFMQSAILAAATPTSTVVSDIDNPARQPVQFNATVQFTAGNTLATVDSPFLVPSGKRLVIETITGEIFVPQGQQIRPTLITTAAGNFAPNHTLVFNSKVTFGFQDIYRATLPVRFYADPGTSILLSIHRDSTTGNSGIAEITFSGYLVKLP
jgi:hypothetical protein